MKNTFAIVAALLALPLVPSTPAFADSYTLTLPPGFSAIANQLDNGSNSLVNVFGANLPDGTSLTLWNRTNCPNPTNYYYDTSVGISSDNWYAADQFTPVNANAIKLSPGDGAFINLPFGINLTFSGMPHVPVLPVFLPCGCGHYYLLSQQTNSIGTFENIVGLAPTEGVRVLRWTGSGYTTNAYSSGSWSAGTPSLNVGEPAWFFFPCPPAITNQPQSQVVTAGSNVTFTVGATGTLPLNYQWRFNGTNLPGAIGASLAIMNAQSTNAGAYDVVVTNIAGAVTSSVATLTIQGAVELDFGDAPGGYPTLLANNGAHHTIVAGIRLGATIDAETDGQPDLTQTAIGDDYDSRPNDEDGVLFLTPLVPGNQATIKVVASAAGKLDAWMDFNGDNDWADEGEKVFNSVALNMGANTLNFNVPAGAVKDRCTFARFRFSSAGGLSYEDLAGPAEDGEVEDYALGFNDPPPAPPLLTHTWVDNNGKHTCEIDIVFVGNANIPPPNHPEARHVNPYPFPALHPETDPSAHPVNDVDGMGQQFFSIADAVRRAIAAWNAANTGWKFNYPAAGGANPVLTVKLDSFGGGGPPHQGADVDNALAKFISGIGAINSAQLVFNADVTWGIGENISFCGGSTDFDPISVALHELGHALRLDHPAAGGTLKGWTSFGDTVMRPSTDANIHRLNRTETFNRYPHAVDIQAAKVSCGEDFGDAPDPAYPTKLTSDGARHLEKADLYLGAKWDGDLDGQPNANATGDDLADDADEDGVTFTSDLVQGRQATVTITASKAGKLDAWVDFDANGSWADAGEQIFASEALVMGANNLTFDVPAGATVTNSTFARFRFSSAGGLVFTGEAADGEVEDYEIEIKEPPVAPQVEIQPPEQSVTEGQDATFQAIATGTPPLKYQWYFNQTNSVPGGIYPTLVLSSVPASFAGYYTVVVSNGAGAVTSAPALLNVTNVPGSGAPVVDIGVSNGLLIITWSGADWVLQEATDPSGPWFDLPFATSPYAVVPSDGGAYYRLRYQPHTPTADLDLGTVFMGFGPSSPGSSVELDLQPANHLLRLTAWVGTVTNRFLDFNIDLGPVIAETWQRTTNAGTDHLVFSYQDASKNIRISGDLVLQPDWRGTLTTEPINPGQPMDNVPFLGSVEWTMVRAPQAGAPASGGVFVPVPYSVLRTVTPTISVPIEVIGADQGHVFLDDGWDETSDSLEITTQFQASGTETVAAGVPFRYGANRLRFVFPEGSFEVFCLNYEQDTTVLERRVGDDSGDFLTIALGSESRVFVKNAVEFFAPEGQRDRETSAFLRAYRLRLTGCIPGFASYQALVHGKNLTQDKDSNGLPDLLDYPTQAPDQDPRARLFNAEWTLSHRIASEAVSPVIANNNATLGYDAATSHGWNDPGGAPEPASGLDLAREHFWMDTFAGHRRISRFVGNLNNPPNNNPSIGIVDTGFGDGDAFPNNDFPLAAFDDLWALPGNNNALAVHINVDNAGRRVEVANEHLHNPLIQDDETLVSSHGTAVAHMAAARGGSTKMGVGINSRVSIYKVSGFNLGHIGDTWHKAVLAQAKKDSWLRVLNLSNGGTLVNPTSIVIPGNPAAQAAQRAAVTAYNAKVRQTAEYIFDAMSREGIISILAAGNGDEAPQWDNPTMVAPVRGNRHLANDEYSFREGAPAADGMSSLALRIAAWTPPDNAANQESVWDPAGSAGSGFGNNISVAAHGNNVDSVDARRAVRQNEVGTSYAAPITAGLVSEVLRVVELRAGLGLPEGTRQRRNRANNARKAVEIVEATADRLNRNIGGDFDEAEPADDDTQGFGRINVFKAALTAMNDGLADGGTVQPTPPAGHSRFNTLNKVDADHTGYYGFLIRLASNSRQASERFSNTSAWINENPYNDTVTPATNAAAQLDDDGANTGFTMADGPEPHHFVIAYKRQQGLNSRTPAGFTVGAGGVNAGVHEMVFSAARNEVIRANQPPANRRLELRRNGQTASDQPFFSIPLDLTALRNNAAAPDGNGTNIRFDDFVFEILVDHSVIVNQNEVVIGAGAGQLLAVDEVELTVTVFDNAEAGVAGIPVRFRVTDVNGAESNAKQIRVRPNRGGGAVGTDLTVNTGGGGVASVFATRVAAGAGGNAPQGVDAHIRIDVPINSGGGAAAGQQFPQEFTVPTR